MLVAAYINPVRGIVSNYRDAQKLAQVAVENFLNPRNHLQNTSYKKSRKPYIDKR